jgi:hypothetical protein
VTFHYIFSEIHNFLSFPSPHLIQLYQAMGGAPQFAVLTGGDTIMALAVFPIAIRIRFFLFQLPYMRTAVQAYHKRAQAAFDMFGISPGGRKSTSTPG